MTKKRIGRLLVKVLGLMAFAVVSFFALFLAYGYEADFSFRTIKKTSIVDVTGRYKNVRVFLDSELKSTELPFQIKGILPGSYLLSVQKTGFLPWQRMLQVTNDFVTKVNDVLLFPEELQPFIKTVDSFVPDARFFMGKNALAIARPHQTYLTLISFFPDGTLKHDEVPLESDDLKNIEFSSDNNMVISFKESHQLQVVNVDSLESISFVFPSAAHHLRIHFGQRMVYFVADGNLYGITFARLKDFGDEDQTFFQILSHVDQFTFGTRGVYFLRDGAFFIADFRGKNIRLIDQAAGFTNLSARLGEDYDFLILRHLDERRLYFVDRKGIFTHLTSLLDGDFLLSHDDKVLFATIDHGIILYDPNLGQKQSVRKMATDFRLVSWYGEDTHFIFVDGQELKLADLSFSNVYTLGQSGDGKPESGDGFLFNSQVYVNNTAIYFLTDRKLQVLSW